jgi:8-oxo-dGTP diphosphatase
VTAIGQPSQPVTVVVDVANVMGARPDGWWRDRAGAARRLLEQVAALADRGVPADRMPDGLPAPGAWVLVLEGRAREAARDDAGRAGDSSAPSRVRVVAATGSGDDAIVAEAAALSGGGAGGAGGGGGGGVPCLVVTADRELRRRCAAVGAVVAGPGWLLGLL